MKLKLEIDVEIKEDLEEDIIATVYYPDEGNKIQLAKGLNTVEVSEAIFHEIGHIIDWYLSSGKQSETKYIREKNADVIGQGVRHGNEKLEDSCFVRHIVSQCSKGD